MLSMFLFPKFDIFVERIDLGERYTEVKISIAGYLVHGVEVEHSILQI